MDDIAAVYLYSYKGLDVVRARLETCSSAIARSAVGGSILLGWRVEDMLLLHRQAMGNDHTRAKLR